MKIDSHKEERKRRAGDGTSLSAAFSLVSLLSALVACSSGSGGGAVGDGGSEGGRDGAEAAVCSLPAPGIDVAFDLTCTGGCQATMAHVAFHVDASDPNYAMICQHTQGQLQIQGLSTANGLDAGGPDGGGASTLAIGVTGYAGPGQYVLGQTSFFAYQNAVVSCTTFGDLTIDMLIPQDQGTCNVDVTTDCTDTTGRRGVSGTFNCTFADVGRMTMCSLANGTLSFGSCP
jgi:hypothetical protein